MFEQNRCKIFVIDTNVVLYDYQCIYNFEEHNVVIPITILEEIDRFKRGNEIINYNARQFARELDKLIGDKPLKEGVKLKGGGLICIEASVERDEFIEKLFWEDKPDHRILTTAYNLVKKHGEERVILVSKDVNLRMKAKSLNIQAEDYTTGKIKNIDELYKGKNLAEGVTTEAIDKLYKDGEVSLNEIGFEETPKPNEYFILRNSSKSALGVYHHEAQHIQLVEKRKAFGVTPRNSEQTFSLHALQDNNIRLVTMSGKAGTGKTLMALAGALEKRKDFKQILLARPIIPLANRDIGYLPGDIASKIDPYMQPLFDNLSFIQNQFSEESMEYRKINDLIQTEKLKITPLAYIRGRSLSKVFFIVDEAQNLTPHEVKTIITRAGEGTKIIFTGDPYQIDTPYLDSQSNGLSVLIDKMKGQELYAHVTLEKGERSELAEIASNIL